MNVPDKFVEWAGGVSIAVVGGLIVALRRWISMLHKHEQQIALLQQSSLHQQETNNRLLEALAGVKEGVEQNRTEAASRMDSIRIEIREDINRLMNLMGK